MSPRKASKPRRFLRDARSLFSILCHAQIQALKTLVAKPAIVSRRTAIKAKAASNPFEDELCATAKYIATRGKGILASDESNATTGKRLDSVGVENTEENRRNWRQLLYTAPGLGQYISGAIMFEETL